MRGRTIFIVLALIAVLVVVVVALFGLQAPPPSQAVAAHPPTVLVAADPIPVGTLIKPQDVTWGPKPADALSGTTFDRDWADNADLQAAADARTQTNVLGAVARHRIEPGEAILHSAVVKPGDSGFLAAVLRPGMRALTVAVTVVTGAGGNIYPGDHVDIILSQDFSGIVDTSGKGAASIGKRRSSETVAEDVRVLAIDQQLQVKTDPNAGQAQGKVATTVTLEVDPVQAEKVVVASKIGEMSLVVRSLDAAGKSAPDTAGSAPLDAPVWSEDVSNAIKETQKQLKDAAPPAEAAKPSILVIRGGQADTVGVH
jgi:pilus assembly protein CpaB